MTVERETWCYGYAVCRECIASPHPNRYMHYYVDEHGRCYCRECAPATPDVDDDRAQAGLEQF